VFSLRNKEQFQLNVFKSMMSPHKDCVYGDNIG